MNSICIVFCVFLLPAFALCKPADTVIKSSTVPEDNYSPNEANLTKRTDPANLADFQPLSIVKRDVGYMENERYSQHPYPMIMLKRSASMLNRLVYQFTKSFDKSGTSISPSHNKENDKSVGLSSGSAMQNDEPFPLLQRRDQKERKYLRCYFNAVSCFKKRN